MSLPQFSEESGSSYVLGRHHLRRDDDRYLFIPAHTLNCVCFFRGRKAVRGGTDRGFGKCAKWDCIGFVAMSASTNAEDENQERIQQGDTRQRGEGNGKATHG